MPNWNLLVTYAGVLLLPGEGQRRKAASLLPILRTLWMVLFSEKKIYIYIPPLIVMWIGTRSTNVLRHLWFGLGFFCSVLGRLGSASWVYLTVALKVALTTWRSSLINQIDFQPSLTTHHRQTTCSKELVQGFGLRPSQHTAIFSISIKWHLQIYIYI